MKKILFLFILTMLLSTTNQVLASGCYQDPIYTRDWQATVKSAVFVRDDACMTNTSVIKTLSANQAIQIIGETDGWYKVKDADGTIGWSGATFFNVNKTSNTTITTKTEYKQTKIDSALGSRLTGRILLQVESAGEAWYVYPSDQKRYSLGRPDDAFNIMRSLGLGITNNDLNKIPQENSTETGDLNLINRLAGKILLQIEENGEAWYVNPVDGHRYYLGRPTDAFNIMRKLGLGITNSDLNNISTSTDYSTNQDTITNNNDSEITLNGSLINNTVNLNWTVNNVNVDKGFKVVISKNINPVYPGDTYHYFSDKNKRADSWSDLETDKTYYFRVCQYLGGKCGTYSNNYTIKIPANTYQDDTNNNQSNYQEGVIPSNIDLEVINKYWLDEINKLRSDANLRQLVLDQRWIDTATEWSVYMGENRTMSHERPDGKSMHQWIDTKNLDYTTRYSTDGWQTNYFTENIAWGYSENSMADMKNSIDNVLEFYLSEKSYNGDHYRTIYHKDWNSVGSGFYFIDTGNGNYKVYMTFHYGSLEL